MAQMQQGSFLQEFIGGTVGGVTGILTVYPLDTVKCRLQTHRHYSGMGDVFREMVRTEGATSLYRGLLSPVVGFGALFAMSFSAYGQAGRYFRSRDTRGLNPKEAAARELDLWEMTLAGAWAGFWQAPGRQVFERVKGVMQVRHGTGGKGPYSWTGACLADLVRKEGIQMGLFRGMGATFLREIPQFMVYYPVYELCRRAFAKKTTLTPSPSTHISENTPGVHEATMYLLLAGGIAGTAQWLPPIYCFDVIKTKMQTAQPGQFSSIVDTYHKTIKADGVRGLFRGLGPSLIRAFILHAVIFCGYDTTLTYLNK